VTGWGDKQDIRPALTDDLVREVEVTVQRVDGIGDGRHAISLPLDRAKRRAN
jgi:hypothetical protein